MPKAFPNPPIDKSKFDALRSIQYMLGCALYAVSVSLLPWERTDIDRYSGIDWSHPGFYAYPVARDADGFLKGIRFRKRMGFKQTLAQHGTSDRRIFIDMGARQPTSSIAEFKHSYPGGNDFYVYAFEADAKFHAAYSSLPNTTLVPSAISTFDGECFMSATSLAAHITKAMTVSTPHRVQCVDAVRWLRATIPSSAFTVAKIDIEGGEYELIPYLLRNGDVLRLIDEMYIECHNKETWKLLKSPHKYGECLEMYKSLRAAGVFVHEWF